MDSGVFSRRRAMVWCWVWLPVLLIGGAEWAIQASMSRTALEVVRLQHMGDLLVPKAGERLEKAESLLDQFHFKNKSDSLTAESMSAKLNECAHRHGFTIDLLRFQNAPAGGGKLPGVVVELEGTGGIVPLLCWLNEMQQPGNLLVLDAASVHLLRTLPEPEYGVKLQFRFFSF